MSTIIIKFVDGDVMEHTGAWKINNGTLQCVREDHEVIRTIIPLSRIYRIDEKEVKKNEKR